MASQGQRRARQIPPHRRRPLPRGRRSAATILNPILNAATRAIGGDFDMFQLTDLGSAAHKGDIAEAGPPHTAALRRCYSSDLNLSLTLRCEDEGDDDDDDSSSDDDDVDNVVVPDFEEEAVVVKGLQLHHDSRHRHRHPPEPGHGRLYGLVRRQPHASRHVLYHGQGYCLCIPPPP